MMKLAIAFAVLTVGIQQASADDVWSDGARLGISPGGMYFTGNGNSATGYGGNAWIGYEIEHGSVAFTPLLDLGYAYFSGTPSSNLAYAIPTLQIALHNGPWVPAVEVGVGYGYSWASVSSVTVSDNYLALSIGAELDYRISPGFLLGVAAHYKPFVEPALNSFVDFGLNATFAL